MVYYPGHFNSIVEEYGIAYLYGKDLKKRAFALAEIAHPDHRERLLKAAHDRLGSLKSWV